MFHSFSKLLLEAQLITVVIFIGSCTQDINFERNKWPERADPIYPSAYRAQMLRDLTTNHKLVSINGHG